MHLGEILVDYNQSIFKSSPPVVQEGQQVQAGPIATYFYLSINTHFLK